MLTNESTTTPQTEWERLVPPGTPLVICGAGNLCRQLFEQFPLGVPGHPTIAISDNDPSKHGRSDKYGCAVFDPEFVIKYVPVRTVYVILVHLGAEDVRQQLIGLGVSPDRIIHWWTLWQHYDTLKMPAWADVPEHPDNWLDVWSDEESKQVIRDAYDFFKTYSDRTAVYKPREAYSLPENIYFDETVYRRLPDERFLDCGAFDGDTLTGFYLHYCDVYKTEAMAVEASPQNYSKLLTWLGQPIFTPNLINAVLVGDPAIETVQFSGHGVSACIGDGVEVCATTIDKLCERYNFRPSLVKLDIEGAELDALHGAEETIKRDRPVLSVCLYHHPRDLWEIPAFLASVCEDYCFYAACYDLGQPGFEVIMYAVPTERTVRK
jgi:FkbM family methyltransferase